jgi:hypothetical protein
VNNLNLHGRHPKDLPDKETLEDILLELKDTHKFEIKWIDLKSFGSYINWQANGKVFDNWVERGEVVTCEMNPTFPTFNISQDCFDQITMSYATVKETRYDILRHPIRLEVKLKADVLSLNEKASEIIETSKDVYLRLKDYLGPDVIQDQSSLYDFVIDFMLTSCKVK